jgi:hypothetical protein
VELLFTALRTHYNISPWNGLQKSIEKNFRSYWYRTDRHKKKIIIIELYRPPSSALHGFFVHLTDILEQLVQKDCYIILLGDLKINTQEDGCGHKQLLDVANIYNLTMTINTPHE